MKSSNLQTKTYYRIVLFQNGGPAAQNSVLYGKYRMNKKTYSWLTYSGDDQELPFNHKGREDENLATQILIQNRETNPLLTDVLEGVLYGHFDKVIVQKFNAVYVVTSSKKVLTGEVV